MLRQVFSRAAVALLLVPAAIAAQAPQSNDDLAAKVRTELAAARKLPASLDKVVSPVIDRVWDGFDRDAAIGQVQFMDGYWRLPGNEGFDKSIDRVKARLVAAGFKELAERPKTPITVPSLWIEPASTPSSGWDQQVGTVAIVRDGQPEQVVLSREKERLALAINSFSTAPGGVVVPLIDVGAGNSPNDYANKEVKGAVVVGTAGTAQLYTQAVVNRGAVGVISTAKVPAYLDPSPDLLQWGSITYDETRKPFGFRATPRAAETLKAATNAGPVKVRVEVATTFARKPERTLAAEIPGATVPNERIVIAAHVQEPGANDNASGTATNMELTRALVTGVLSGRIPKPARTLTFLWVNEISGSRRWLSEHADQKDGVKYMFSMDMTGEDITKTGGHFLVERFPDPGSVWARPWDPHTEWGPGNVNPNSLKGDLINDLHLAMCERVAVKSMASAKRPWDVRSNPYEGGSDHTQFRDAGIPSLLDWHFTDRFYHTNRDTAEKTSPDEMRNVGTAVATTAWLMASATDAIAADVKTLVAKAGDARVAVEKREGAIAQPGVKPEENDKIVAAWRKWYDEAIASVSRLVVPAKRPAPIPSPAADLEESRSSINDTESTGPQSGPFVVEDTDTGASQDPSCDQTTMGPIPATVLNVLWAADDRLVCSCGTHTEQHKESREHDLLFDTALRAGPPEIRRAAALALGRLESPQTITTLLTLLRDRNADVRAEAANALAQTAKAGRDDVMTIAQHLTFAIAAIVPPDLTKRMPGRIFAAGSRPRGQETDAAAAVMFEAIGRLPFAAAEAEAAAAYLHGCMLDPWCEPPPSGAAIDFRVSAPRLLGIAKGFESISRKFPRANYDGIVGNLRLLAANGRNDFTRVRGAFDNRRTDAEAGELVARLRRLTMQTLQNIGDKDRDTILGATNDGDWQVRRIGTMMLASQALTGPAPGQSGPAADDLVVNALAQRLKDSAFQVRLEAVKVAARVAARTGDCSDVLNATRDDMPIVAMQALDGIVVACKDMTPILERLHTLADTLEDTSSNTVWQVGARALTAMARVAEKEAAPYVAKRPLFASPIWQLRASIATTAGRVKNEEVLLTLVKDPVPNVRNAALEALKVVGSTHLFEEALENLTSTDFQLVRTAAISLKGAPKNEDTAMALIKALKRLTDEGKDTSRDPRMALIERIDEQVSVEMISLVQPFLSDFDPAVANAVKAVCERLVPNGSPAATPRLRKPVQATLEEIQDLPKTATLVMQNGDRIELELLVEEAPMTIARFASLARAGYYNGLTFHRIVANFVIQGGSPGASEYVGDARYMRDEVGRVPNLRGAVGISTRGRDTGDAQIFIDLVDLPRLDHDYTVFANVTSGMPAVDKILEGATIATVVIK